MLTASLLVKKRDGHALTEQEIQFLVDGFCRGEVADYQMSALAMAICLRGMNPREISDLTRAMHRSGDSLPRIPGRDRPRVDKHSTGGLGDKVSLILAPLLAACGADVPMISGRGLGLSGGTLDKLEAIEGFRTQLSAEESSAVLREVGAFIVGASDRIAPADRRWYALRDVTGTVESTALITSSILCKKLSASLDALVMDIKVGRGAFMKTVKQARELAESIVRVGNEAGLPTTAILSDMDQPLGAAIGNALEVNEAVQVLRGEGPVEVRELTVQLAADLLVQVQLSPSREQAVESLESVLDQGQAMQRFEQLVRAQGGSDRFPLKVATKKEILAREDGYLAGFDCKALGEAVVGMGGGRRRADDLIDPTVGICTAGRVGDRVQRGQPILTLYCHRDVASNYDKKLSEAVSIVPHAVPSRELIVERL